MALSTRMYLNSPSAQNLYTFLVDTWRYAATSFFYQARCGECARASIAAHKVCAGFLARAIPAAISALAEPLLSPASRDF